MSRPILPRSTPDGPARLSPARLTMSRPSATLLPALLLATTTTALAQDTDDADTPEWDVTLARGETREIDFETDEGTWMSVDISPDGTWIVFDLLAHVYRVPAEGGLAESLTQESGVAVNYHPGYSPDGRHIAFVSDRGGQNNLWVMDADGSNPRQVQSSQDTRVTMPEWTADGQYILVAQGGGIWMYHVDGGTGIEVVSSDEGVGRMAFRVRGRPLPLLPRPHPGLDRALGGGPGGR